MVDFSSADEAAIVSALAKALEILPGVALGEPLSRFVAYPQIAVAGLGDDYTRLDLLACKAEMIRRALRVGHGFPKAREAA